MAAKCFDFHPYIGRTPHREPVPARRYLLRSQDDHAAGKHDIPICDECFALFVAEVHEYNEWTPLSVDPLSDGGA